MAFGRFVKQFRTSTHELHERELARRFQEIDVEPIVEMATRRRVCIAGEVKGVRVVPRAGSPSLEVTVSDGTGSLVAVFHGRRAIAGVAPGRHLLLVGVARREGRQTEMMNPTYTLLPR